MVSGGLRQSIPLVCRACAHRRLSLFAPSADLYAEMCHKLEKYAQDLTDYFPKHHFGSAKILAKPRNTAWSQREAMVVDGYGNTIIFFQDLSR